MPTQDDKNPEEAAVQPSEPPIDTAPPATNAPEDPPAAAAPTETALPSREPNPNKKRKCALFLSYVGHGYQGMQRNPGARTIEDDLFQAIVKAGGVSEANADEEGFKKVKSYMFYLFNLVILLLQRLSCWCIAIYLANIYIYIYIYTQLKYLSIGLEN
jgi:hypothetical protein